MVLTAAAAFLAFVPSVTENIEVGQANWAAYPRLETASISIPDSTMVGNVEQILRSGECELEGQRPGRFDINVNYAVRLDPAGNATRIIVEDVGCRPIELLVGRIAAQIVARGHVRTPAPAQPTLYSSRVNFNLS